jgi:hypothetical protein
MDEQAKINKDAVTKFKEIDKVLENIDCKVTEVGSSNHQVLNLMKMLETQVGQLVGCLFPWPANGAKPSPNPPHPTINNVILPPHPAPPQILLYPPQPAPLATGCHGSL